MAYIPGFEHDIFISYARIDNRANSEDDYSWIEKFHEKLGLYLNQRLGEDDVIKLWYDNREIDEATDFDEKIKSGVAKSALMICINSHGYKKSKWCKKERASFVSKAEKELTGLKVGSHKRIMSVHLNNIPHKEWPEELAGITGFHFYEAETKEEYGSTIKPDDRKTWNREMLRVRDVVFPILENFKKESEEHKAEPSKETTNTDGGDFKIYLSEVSDSLRGVRRRLIRELEKAGHQVLTGSDSLDDVATHETNTTALLNEANLSIHLLDNFEGRMIQGESDSFYIQKEAEIAINNDVPQIVWMPEGLDINKVDEPIYKSFLSELELRRPEKEYDYIRGVKNNLNQVILDQVALLEDKKRQKDHIQEESKIEGPLKVLIDYQIDDGEFAMSLNNILADHDVKTYYATSAEDPETDNEKFKERFLKSQKFIFLCGDAEIERTTSRLESTLKKGTNLGRWNIGKDIYVYLLPPEKDAAIPPNKYPINIINKSYPNMSEKEIMAQILSDLKVK